MKGNTKYLLILGLMVGLFMLVEYYRPRPIDWQPTYSNRDAIPYGTKATYELLKGTLPNQEVYPIRLPIFNQLRETDLPPQSAYLFINEVFTADKNDLNELLRYVMNGNSVFIAATQLPGDLEDTLHLYTHNETELLRDSTRLNFTNPVLKAQRNFLYNRNWATTSLRPDSTRGPLPGTRALGITSQGKVNFARVPFGKGQFFLHTVPIAFTNYYALKKPTDEYVFKALSYLPSAGSVFWDEYQKQGREDETSLFRFLLTNPSLRWAYYLTLATLVLYVLLESKRRQRAIPVLEPPRNTSLEFVKTVGQLYFQQGNHLNLAEKKISHWLSFVHQRFHLNPSEFDEEFRQRLAAKSGVDRFQIDALLTQIEAIRRSTSLLETQLLDLNRRIDAFYR